MVECTVCRNWVHLDCVGVSKEKVSKGDWDCPNCRGLFRKTKHTEKIAIVQATKLREFTSEKDALPYLNKAGIKHNISFAPKWTINALGELARILHVTYKIHHEKRSELMIK